jgi:putative pyruvate formate lyase activating enzyme
MLRLQSEGCSCIEPVSPSHYLPGLLEAISIARAQGLVLPIVYNSNGYESALTLELLEGVVDVYLPDLRYSSESMAREYSDAPGYVDIARDAIMKMYSHTGDLVVNLQGIAISGIIIRLLVLPNDVAGVEQSLMWIRDNLPASVTLSIMSQYSPLFRAGLYPPLNRATSEDQYNEIIDICWDMGLENAFVQDYESKDLGIPDFESNEPFYWPQVDNRPLRD